MQDAAFVTVSLGSVNALMGTQELRARDRLALKIATGVVAVSHRNGLHTRRPRHMIHHGMQAWHKAACVTLVHAVQIVRWRSARLVLTFSKGREIILDGTVLGVVCVITALVCANAS